MRIGLDVVKQVDTIYNQASRDTIEEVKCACKNLRFNFKQRNCNLHPKINYIISLLSHNVHRNVPATQ